MGKSLNWLFFTIIFILVGIILFSGVIIMKNWDFAKLLTNNFVNNNYEFEEDIKNITIVTDTADVVFQKSENTKINVTCIEQENVKHIVEVKNNALEIKVNDMRKWYERIGVFFKSLM